jgi:hypothetical protein
MAGEVFQAITLEIYVSGAWTDIWTDVLHVPAPKCTRGIGGNAPQDRVAGPGRLTFSLDNSATNSAHLIGRYSPGHANCLTGWTTGIPVRLSFTYDNVQRYKWYGHIEPDGIKVSYGVLGLRRVDVTCYDYMGLITYHKINLLTSQSSKTVKQSIQTIIANMPISPLTTSLDNVNDFALTTVFDTSGADTTALSEFEKLSTANRMFIVVRGDNTGGETLYSGTAGNTSIPLVAASSGIMLMETGDQLLLETGDAILLDEIELLTLTNAEMTDADISYGKDLINYVTVVSYPRELGTVATTVLWTLQQANQLAAGASVTLRGAYVGSAGEKINGTDFVTPVSGTDFAAFANADGTGTNYTANMTVTATFGAAEVELVVTNTHGSASFYFGGASIVFQVRGREVRIQEPMRVITKDTTSINTYGVRPLSVDVKYQSSYDISAVIGGEYITSYDLKNPQYSFDRVTLVANKNTKCMYTFMYLEPHDEVHTISDTMTAVNGDYILQSYDFEIIGGSTVRTNYVFRFYSQ